MTLLLVGIVPVLFIFAAAVVTSRHRSNPIVLIEPRPVTYRSIRVLQDDQEVREVALHACERERRIAHAANRRAEHFGDLTRPRQLES
jgi:uncharacterized membrane protein